MRSFVLLSTLVFSVAVTAAETQHRIHVPLVRATPKIDGQVLPTGKPDKNNLGEWKEAAKVSLGSGSYAVLQHDGKFLYVGLVGAKAGIASLCTGGLNGVRVLHASAALGTAVFEQDKDRKWRMTRGFTWTNREAPDDPQFIDARASTLDKEGWIATTSPHSVQQREYAIYIKGRTEVPIVLGFLTFTPRQKTFLYWPENLEDDCADADLASGFTDRQYTFDPTKWGVAVLMQ
jgi:hypothetical protein